ncbi:flippase-like domain-containing protein [bacterium]|nr:flippase-like domain-containing protein [candidate division CSSED10-310 bacterium]
MRKSIQIIIGILISVALFYWFIKDVNTIRVTANSGKGHGYGIFSDRVVYLSDVSGLRIGDEINIFSGNKSSTSKHTITTIIPWLGITDMSDESQKTRTEYIVILKQPLDIELLVENGAGIKFPRLQRAFKSIQYFWLLPSLLLTLVALWVRSYRWKLFFPNRQNIRMKSLWISVCIGYMANNVLPARMGEVVRAWILGRKENRRTTEAFATIVMERVFDILSILMLFVMFIYYYSARSDITLPDWLKDGAITLAAISLIALAFLLLLKFQTEFSMNILKKLLKPFPVKLTDPLMRMVRSSIEGLEIISSGYASFAAFLLSMAIWIILAFVYYFLFFCVGIEGASLMDSMFLIVGLAFAVSIPSAPGFFGTFHFVGKQILLIVGLKGNIVAYVLLAHAMAFIPVVILGFFYLNQEKISFRDLVKSIQTAKTTHSENATAS